MDIVLQKILSGLFPGHDSESDHSGDFKTGQVADTRVQEAWNNHNWRLSIMFFSISYYNLSVLSI